MGNKKFILTLTEEQAQIVSVACEFYARIRIGQFREIIWKTLDMGLPTDDYCRRRDTAEKMLFAARDAIYPELWQGTGSSYGMGKFEDADKAFDVYQVLRHAMGDDRPPFSNYDLPEVEIQK